jgi:hypothetical protein
MRVPCHVARRIARRWSEAADSGAPPARIRGLTCTTTQEPYDLTVVACGAHKARCARDVAFVWRDPARAAAPVAAGRQALASPEAGAPPEDDPSDEGSAGAHEA